MSICESSSTQALSGDVQVLVLYGSIWRHNTHSLIFLFVRTGSSELQWYEICCIRFRLQFFEYLDALVCCSCGGCWWCPGIMVSWKGRRSLLARLRGELPNEKRLHPLDTTVSSCYVSRLYTNVRTHFQMGCWSSLHCKCWKESVLDLDKWYILNTFYEIGDIQRSNVIGKIYNVSI